MTLPQFHSIFFSLPFSAMPLPQLPEKNFFFFFPISAMALLQLVFFSLDREFGQRNFGNSVAEIQNLSLSNFSSFSLLLLLNFGNSVAEILSLSSFRQLSWNSTYNANKFWILQYSAKRLPFLLHLALQFYFQLLCHNWEGQIVRDDKETRSYRMSIKFKKGK